MKKVTISRDDVFKIYVKNAEQTIEMFGEDYLEEFGIEISEDLLARYEKARDEYEKIQKELRAVLHDVDRKKIT